MRYCNHTFTQKEVESWRGLNGDFEGGVGRCHICWLWFTSPEKLQPPPKRPDAPQEPSLIRKALNYKDDLTQWIEAGKPLVSEEVYQQRRAICDACPDRNPVKDACRWCGCPLKATPLGDRLRWGVPACPAKDAEGNPAPRWPAAV